MKFLAQVVIGKMGNQASSLEDFLSEHSEILDSLPANGLGFDDLGVSDENRAAFEQEVSEEVFQLQENMEGLSMADAIYVVLKNRKDRAPIRFVPFDEFKDHGSIPRLGLGSDPFYDDIPTMDITVDSKSIDRDDSFIVFISHTWLAGKRVII